MNLQKIGKKVVRHLQESGHAAYFAGGWVRDYLMGHPSSDIDIATDASPERIVQLFSKTIPVGISFGVVIVVMDGHQFEVSTFRKDVDYLDGRRPSQIVRASAEEDAKRRDFTINGMFYDPITEVIIDYVQGQQDLKTRIIRTIGDPKERFNEDRLRMVRAIRFQHRFQFSLDDKTEEAIKQYAKNLRPAVAIERIWQEFHKMARFPNFDVALVDMQRLGLLPVIFPKLINVGVEEIKKRVVPIRLLPKGCPTILSIATLFAEETEEDLVNIALFLKVSNAELKLIQDFAKIRRSIKDHIPSDDLDWTKLYAIPSSNLILEVIAAGFQEKERDQFLIDHSKRQHRLTHHIDRVKNKTPVVVASDLLKEGIAAGRLMGELLKAAERISVNHNIENVEEIIAILKKTTLWKDAWKR